MDNVKQATYEDVLNLSGPFVSLDISVQSTGYVHKKSDGSVVYGTYAIQAVTDIERRKEFANFLTHLLSDGDYEFVVIEDVILGNNFATTKILMQLNVIVEDLMEYGKVKKAQVYRQNNKHWKTELERIAGYNVVVKGVSDKERICEALRLLQFTPPVGTAQDVFDAMGIAVAQIMELYGKNTVEQAKPIQKLHADLSVGYRITQYNNKKELLVAAEQTMRHCRKLRDVVYVDSDKLHGTLKDNFRKIVTERGDNNLFVVSYDIDEVGSLLLSRYIDVSVCGQYVYFLARLR